MTLSNGPSTLIAVVDGMGGHAGGSAASEAAIACLTDSFNRAGQPVFDPQGFLIRALERAHEQLVDLGATIPIEYRPRATCAVCLVQDLNAYCAHVGDSRIYHFHRSSIVSRSRDHSHVEVLLQQGIIQEGEMKSHPMRNFVECCLGGDLKLPDMSVSKPSRVRSGDVLLVCTDGLWTGLDDDHLLVLADPATKLDSALVELAETAIRHNAPHSDNTSAAVLRVNGAAT